MSSAQEELKQGTDHLVANVEAYHQALNGKATNWVHDLRIAGLEQLKTRGLPTTKLEGWRYTNIRPLVAKQFSKGDLPALNLEAFQAEILPVEGLKIVLNNGVLDSSLSDLDGLADGVIICSLEEAVESHGELLKSAIDGYATPEDEVFTALNSAYFGTGLFIYIPKSVVFEKTIHLICVSGSTEQALAAHPRVIVLLGENSQATLMESYVGLESTSYLNNLVTELNLGENAVLDHVRLQNETKEAFHLSSVVIRQERSSQLNSYFVSLGAQLARVNIEAALLGPGADCRLQGLYLADEKRHVDIHIVMDHVEGHCTSLQKFKGVLDDKASSIFDSRGLVRKGADKTDAIQQNNNLLLSKNAQANTRPQLEIYADDVKCGHGATVGQLDENQVFYLRSRGLNEDVAKRELTYAFANEVLSPIKDEQVRVALESLVRLKLI